MITIRRQLLGLGLVAASSLLALHTAHAMSGPTAITIDGGPLGSLNLSGGADGYVYGLAGINSSQQTVGANIGSALIDLSKTTGEVQFNIEVGSNSFQTLGALSFDKHGHINETSVSTFSTGPLFVGTITIAPPNSPVTVTAGQMQSLEGYESTVDWANPSQLSTDIFFVQNSNAVGVEAALTEGPLVVTVQFGDGFDTGVWNYLQGLATYTINSDNVANVYGAVNLGRTGPGTFAYNGGTNGFGNAYVNSNVVGAFYSYTMGNLNLIPEAQYVWAKTDHIIGIDKTTSNAAGALFGTYAFGTSPYSIGGWVEFEKSQGNFDWFVGPESEAIGAAVSPTWQYKDLFARANAGAIYLLQNKAFSTASYGSDGTGKFQFIGTLEGGVLF